MACKKVQLRREEHKQRNDVAEAMEAAVTDAFLLATMCVVGTCVDVHTKDGPVFSGMFYAASVDKDYAIVLKNASMIKKGHRHGNVANGKLVETLIIRLEDLVQVVAKGVQLPSNRISGFVGGGRAEIRLLYGEALLKNNSELSCDENSLYFKKDVPPNAKVDEREAQNGLQRRQSGSKVANNNLEVKDEAQEDHELYLNKEATAKHAQARDMPTSIGTPRSTVDTPDVSVPSLTHADVNSESCFGVSPKAYMLSPKKGSGFEKKVKESKLNPGAEIFSPSMLIMRVSSPTVPSGTDFSCIPGTYAKAPIVSAQEADGSTLPHSPVPVKFVPHSNIASANVGYGASYAQPLIGQMVDRSQQVRYAGHYQQIPSAPAYAQQSPQNVMIGPAEPVFSMYTAAGSAAGFSPASLHPPFPIHQTHPPKHQGNIAYQAMNQLSVAPQIMASPPQQSLVLPSSIPTTPTVFPILHPNITPGSYNFAGTKFV